MGPGGAMSNLASVPKSLGQGFALLESEASTHRELARARSERQVDARRLERRLTQDVLQDEPLEDRPAAATDRT